MDKVNLAEKLALFDTRWDPHVVADYEGHDVMVVKVEGAFPWHVHEDADDFFLVLDGRIEIDVEEGGAARAVPLAQGELMVVPAGTRHRPRAEGPAHLLLIERRGMPSTGDPATAARKPRI